MSIGWHDNYFAVLNLPFKIFKISMSHYSLQSWLECIQFDNGIYVQSWVASISNKQ